jgi:predicted transcriptional regulator
MVRKQIVIDREREQTLERLAEELEMSQSEIVREALDDFAEKIAAEDEKEAAWRRLMKFAENAPELGLVDEHGNRTWTRQELHERRGSR